MACSVNFVKYTLTHLTTFQPTQVNLVSFLLGLPPGDTAPASGRHHVLYRVPLIAPLSLALPLA